MRPGTKYLFLILLLIISGNWFSFGQNFKKLVRTGDEAYNKKDYVNAVKSYEKAFQTIRHYKVRHLDLLYKLGHSEMQVADYVKAVNTFNLYLEIAELSLEIVDRRQVEEWLKYTEPRLVVPVDSVKLPGYENIVQIINLTEINTPYDEYTPYYDSRLRNLLYSSGMKESKGTKKLEGKGADIYYSRFDSGKFSAPQPFGTYINTFLQDLDPFISPDDNSFYYTRVRYSDILTKKRYPGKIMVSTRQSGVWTTPAEFSQNIYSDCWNGNLFISNDKKFLFFASEKQGGMGGKDIYYCVYDSVNGSYGDPKNIGAPVNTKFDEIEPKYYPSENVLFFSSRGHTGYGGYDVFYSKYENGKWSQPKNFGTPINSTRDDIGFVRTDMYFPVIAFFASNREGGKGRYDIYRIVFNSEVPVKDSDMELLSEMNTIYKVEVTGAVKKDTLVEYTEKLAEVPLIKADTLIEPAIWPEGLILKVQIGAYRKKISVPDVYLKIDSRNVILEMHDGLYKYLLKDQFRSLNEAQKIQKKYIDTGYRDVWVVPYYDGKRITVAQFKELTGMLYKN